MKKHLNILLLFLAVFYCSCASSYKQVHVRGLNFLNKTENDGLVYSYEYNVLRRTGNKKYAKKEEKKAINVVAVKLKNNTDDIVNFNDIEILSGTRYVYPLDPEQVGKEVKQATATYLLYLLLLPVKVYTYSDNTVNYYNVGLILGPTIAFGNLLVSNTANTNFRYELKTNNLLGRDIHPGEEVYGLLSFRDIGYQPLQFKIRKEVISELK